jgi:Cu+-exporting ATPase
VLDKTGTLTRGRPSVSRVVPVDGVTEVQLLGLAGAAEVGSEHPLGEAIVAEARARGLDLPPATTFQAWPGLGVQAAVDGQEVLVGSLGLLTDHGVNVDDLVEQGDALARAGCSRPAGVLAVADTLKPEAPEVVSELNALRLEAEDYPVARVSA